MVKEESEKDGRCRAPTYFEMLTAMGFKYFEDVQADWAVVEVGLGGRLDSTNVVDPSCCVITSIGLDHVKKLGTTPDAIAREKAGILKPRVPAVLGRQRYPEALGVLRSVADDLGCARWEVGREMNVRDARPLCAPATAPANPIGWRFSLQTPGHDYVDLLTPLLGPHQLDNLAAAIGALEMLAREENLELDRDCVAQAIREFQVAGRVEVLQRGPAVILDVAHTVESVEALLAALELHFPGRPVHLVFGCSTDKDAPAMLRLLLPRCVSFTATQAGLSRATPAEEVAQAAEETGMAGACGGARIVLNPWEAMQGALSRAEPGDVVCSTGSFYTAGEIRAGWLKTHPEADACGPL